MKYIIFSIFLCQYLTQESQAGNDSTPALSIFRDITVCLKEDYLSKGKKLPDSLNEIPMFREMTINAWKDVRSLKLINTLALVPGAPLIRQEDGISPSHWGSKMFAISRTHNTEYSNHTFNGNPEEGRYYITITPDGANATAGWLRESQVQLFFRQVPTFEPLKQPFTFANIDEIDREQKSRLDQSNQDVTNNLSKIKKLESKVKLTPNVPNPEKWEQSWVALFALAVILVGLLIWFVMRHHTHG